MTLVRRFAQLMEVTPVSRAPKASAPRSGSPPVLVRHRSVHAGAGDACKPQRPACCSWTITPQSGRYCRTQLVVWDRTGVRSLRH